MQLERVSFARCKSEGLLRFYQGHEYRVIEIDESNNRYLAKNCNNASEWVSCKGFNSPRVIQSFKNLVYLGKSNNQFTQGEIYSVFYVSKEKNEFGTVDDNENYGVVSFEGFKNASEFKPEDITVYMNGIKEREAKRQAEIEAREAQNREYLKQQKEKQQAEETKRATREEKWFYPNINFLLIFIAIGLKVFKLLDLYFFIILLPPMISINGVFIYQVMKKKQNKQIEKKSQIDLEHRNQLLSLLSPETTLRIKTIESKSALLRQSEFVSGVWLDTILDYICLTIQGSVYEGKILESCEDKINNFLTACENYLDTISKDVESREQYLKNHFENKANSLIEEKTEIIRSITQNIESTIES